MSPFRAPHKSGPHRIAAIALYRALLTQCRALPSAQIQKDELQNIVRHRFKQTRIQQSEKRLRISFEAGYEALDYLDASIAGDGASTEYISSLLERAPARLKVPPMVKQLPATVKQPTPSKTHGHSILERPLPLSSLSGKRHVPVLVDANHIPMLRIKKPQPESLSGYLRHRLHKRQVRHDRKDRLEQEKSLAACEDEWDDLLDLSELDDNHSEPQWVDAIQGALRDVQRTLFEEKRKNQIMATKMQAVVDREQALFDQEELERKNSSPKGPHREEQLLKPVEAYEAFESERRKTSLKRQQREEQTSKTMPAYRRVNLERRDLSSKEPRREEQTSKLMQTYKPIS